MRELGLKPEETYVLEDFGPLAKTKMYKTFLKKIRKKLYKSTCSGWYGYL